MQLLNWPNFISIARLLSVPIIINLILSHQMLPAFWVFLCASISDAFDGYLARKLKARTELGSYLDPLADKALLISIYLTLGITGYISCWLVTFVIFRDILIVGGTILLFILERPIRIEPIFISKINTFFQILFASFLLFEAAFKLVGSPLFILVLEYTVGITTLLSGAFYVKLWIKRISMFQGNKS